MFLREGTDMAFKVKRPSDCSRGKASSVRAARDRHDTIPARCERPRRLAHPRAAASCCAKYRNVIDVECDLSGQPHNFFGFPEARWAS
jgi:hypothetical protein